MNPKSLNPNLVSTILVVFAGLILAVLPVRLQIVSNSSSAQAESTKTVEYTLRTILGQTPPMALIGVGGDIDGVINPDLKADVGDTVKITVINGDPVLHDFVIDEFNAHSEHLAEQEQQAVVEFVADKTGEFQYYCSVPGHREAGMVGNLVITGDAPMENMNMQPAAETVALQPTAAPADPNAVSVIRNPADVPASVGNREAQNVRIDLTAKEVVGQLADGTTYSYFTFDGAIPGPMLRIRVGDNVELYLKNDDGSLFPHSIDLHAVTGPGGGAVYTQTNPGEETFFSFQALQPGLYVYHCATPSVAHHITSGMYGLILVEPEGGLPPVDKEFYVMQGEIYSAEPFGTQGNLTFSYEKMLDEEAEYLVFNGASMALTQDEYALRANVGDTVRIYFGVGGPNYTSSFHVIGEIFDRVYNQASLTSDPLLDVQTTSVAPGGATMVEFDVEVPGRYILVDHALARLERGLAGYLYVEGDENPEIFNGDALTAGSGH